MVLIKFKSVKFEDSCCVNLKIIYETFIKLKDIVVVA